MRRLFTGLLLAIALLSTRTAFAEIINAESGSSSDVQNAINSAKDGDTVVIPAGSWTWSSKITMNKGITLQGAGIDQTFIDNTYGGRYDGVLEGTSSSEREITGFTFTKSASGSSFNIELRGAGRFRIHHCKFDRISTAIRLHPSTSGDYGLVDNCTFDAKTTNAEIIQIVGDGRTSWTTPNSYGTDKAVYIEDCTFTKKNVTGPMAGHCIVGANGARYVLRYCTVYDMDVDAHGYCESAFPCSTRHIEVYENEWYVSSGKNLSRWVYIRGGSAIVFNNSMTEMGRLNEYDITFQEQQVGRTDCGCACSYPAPDQIGRGQNQELDPVYVWNNTVDGNPVEVIKQGYGSGCDSYCGKTLDINDYIQEGREYYLTSKPGYTPYTYPHPLTVSQDDMIIDDSDPGTTAQGNWKISNGANPYGTRSLYSSQAGDTYSYKTALTGDYEVSLRWTYYSSRCSNVAIDIYDGGALLDTVTVDQLQNAGQWNVLGTYTFSGQAEVVVNSNDSCSTCADAVKFTISDNSDDVIIDDGESGTTAQGDWKLSGGANPYGTRSLCSSQAGDTYSYKTTLTINEPLFS